MWIEPCNRGFPNCIFWQLNWPNSRSISVPSTVRSTCALVVGAGVISIETLVQFVKFNKFGDLNQFRKTTMTSVTQPFRTARLCKSDATKSISFSGSRGGGGGGGGGKGPCPSRGCTKLSWKMAAENSGLYSLWQTLSVNIPLTLIWRLPLLLVITITTNINNSYQDQDKYLGPDRKRNYFRSFSWMYFYLINKNVKLTLINCATVFFQKCIYAHIWNKNSRSILQYGPKFVLGQ